MAMARTPESANTADYISLKEATTMVGKFFNTPNIRVIDFRVGAFAAEKLGYLGDYKLLTVELQRDHGDQTEECTFFLKAVLPIDFGQLTFAEEKEFFNGALPRLLADFKGESWAPQCYLVKDNLLVLEDLKAQGFRTASCRHKLTDGQLRTATATVARFHACSTILQAKLDEKGLPNVFAGRFKEKMFWNDNEGLAWKWLVTGIEVAESVARDLGLDPKLIAVAYDILLEQVQRDSTEARGNVLCHEDLWCNNLMFSDDDEHCRLVDFQMIAYGSFAIDVLQMLYVNADRDARQRLEHQLISLYHSVLEKTLVEHDVDAGRFLSLDKVFETIEERRICGLVMAVQMKPVILLNAQFAEEYAEDPVLLEYYAYTSRKDFVNKAMRSDQNYRRALEVSVRELVDFMEHFQGT